MMEFIAQNMAPIMFLSLIGFMLVGYPVAFALTELQLANGRCLRFDPMLDTTTLTRLIRVVEAA